MTRAALSLRSRGYMTVMRPVARRLRHSMPEDDAPDRVIVNSLDVRLNLRGHRWSTEELMDQPVKITISAHSDTSKAGYSDDLEDSFSYVVLAERARFVVEGQSPPVRWRSLYQVASSVAKHALAGTSSDSCNAVAVEVVQPEGALQADSLALELHMKRGQSSDVLLYTINNLRLNVLIGVLDQEQTQAQPIVVTIKMHAGAMLEIAHVVTAATEYIQDSHFQLIEALCHQTSLYLMRRFEMIDDVEMRIRKPSAAIWTESMDVQTFRSRASSKAIAVDDMLLEMPLRDSLRHRGNGAHVAVLALGSNLGDRADYLWRALDAVRADPRTSLLDTSFLYESEPMYVLDQPPFLNACFAVRLSFSSLQHFIDVEQISTDRSPAELLDLCKEIESKLGRIKTIQNGPRCIDLDILLYDDMQITEKTVHGPLTVPHAEITIREFVLRPLMDLIPDYRLPRPLLTVKHAYESCMSGAKRSELRRVFALRSSPGLESPLLDLDGPTQIMSIINVTPDSFSDGGKAFLLEDALMSARRHQKEGAHLLDIGGASTRPGAQDPGTLEESRRVVPVIEALRKEGSTLPISVDTYRADVAHQAIEAGANVVNDVSCGAYLESEGLLEKASELRCPLILMHSRGTPGTMSKMLDYGELGVVAGARQELSARVEQAMALGVPRWAIMVDPGIGFAKDTQKNLEILRGLDSFCTEELQGFPMLFGASRKRFLGALTGQEVPRDRAWATSATVTAAIQAGAHIVRVHDTKEMKDVAKVADAIWKSPNIVH